MLKKIFVLLMIPSFILSGCMSRTGTLKEHGTTSFEGTETLPMPQKSEFSIDDVVFLGDSNIAHLSSYGLLPETQIWTGCERYLTLEPDVCRKYIVYPKTGEEMTVSDAVKRQNPEYLVITLGTDGAVSLDRAGFRLSYISLIDSIRSVSSKTQIVLQSIFPICEAERNGRFSDPVAVNEKFRSANAWLREIAEEQDLIYIDTYNAFADTNGMLRAEFNSDHLDGYHLNKRGLSLMLNCISEELRREK